MAQSLQGRLWLHTQRQLSEKPAKPHEAFCSFGLQVPLETESGEESDDILHGWSVFNERDDCGPLYEHAVAGLDTTPPVSEPDVDLHRDAAIEKSPFAEDDLSLTPKAMYEEEDGEENDILPAASYISEHRAISPHELGQAIYECEHFDQRDFHASISPESADLTFIQEMYSEERNSMADDYEVNQETLFEDSSVQADIWQSCGTFGTGVGLV